ncbi:Rv3235 family protein [Streptomonospora sp. S1-112]|uniref:Rv3235 family protein n=1 Tax=Streptomonospora mangrovi TaxID=2883123 RepID=A0A9X3NNF4_9ACTN|nr:Rv3235 family protein [Streptomonospora mangrovi]MDA0566962.1 Rv3235 family protein [Streptomonospora mangrovi]
MAAHQLTAALCPGAQGRPRRAPAPARPGGAPYPRTRSARHLTAFAQVVAEVLAGDRPAGQVRPLLSRRAYELLERRAGAYACARRPRLRRAVLTAPGSDVAEVTAVIDCGSRCRALALRITYAEHAWLCTHLETDVCGPRRQRRGGR